MPRKILEKDVGLRYEDLPLHRLRKAEDLKLKTEALVVAICAVGMILIAIAAKIMQG